MFGIRLFGLPTIETKGDSDNNAQGLYHNLCGIMRKCIFRVLLAGPIPTHVAFIMDGNRRYATRHGLAEGEGHKAGYSNLLQILVYCYEMGVKYVTVYAFSIDNFNRRPEEVQGLMDLLLEGINNLLEEGSLLKKYGIRVYFIGNLNLLDETVRSAVDKAMKSTEDNKKAFLLVCVAYTSCDEMANSMGKSCQEKMDEVGKANGIDDKISSDGEGELPRAVSMVDIEKNMYMSVAPDPDIVIRTSGETRLSNFLLWQTPNSQLQCPEALFPDFGMGDLIWAVVKYQRSYSYLHNHIKKSEEENKLYFI